MFYLQSHFSKARKEGNIKLELLIFNKKSIFIMKAVLDIILVIIMLSVMVMLLLGVNQLADLSNDSQKQDSTILDKDYKQNSCGINRRNLSGIFLLRRTNINNKNR